MSNLSILALASSLQTSDFKDLNLSDKALAALTSTPFHKLHRLFLDRLLKGILQLSEQELLTAITDVDTQQPNME